MASDAELDLATLGALVRKVGDAATAESRAFALALESATPDALSHLYDTHLAELNAVQAMTFMIDLLACRYAGLRVAPKPALPVPSADDRDFHRVHLRWTEAVIAVSVATLDVMRDRASAGRQPGIAVPVARRVRSLDDARSVERQSWIAMERLIQQAQAV